MAITVLYPGDAPAGGGPLAPTQANANALPDTAPWYERFARGAASEAGDLWTGLKQAALEGAPGAIRILAHSPFAPPVVGARLGDAAAQSAQDALAPTVADLRRQVDQSVMGESGRNQSTPAGQVGAFLSKAIPTTAAVIAAPEVFAAPAGAAALGAISGAIDPVGTEDSRPTNTVVGAVLSAAAQKLGTGASSLVSGVKPAASDLGRQQFMTWAKKNGVPLTRYQMGGDPFVGLLERFGQKLPGSSDFYSGVANAQREAVTNQANRLTMNGLSGDAMDALGTAAGGKVPIDTQLISDIAGLPGQCTNRAGKLIPKEAIGTAQAYAGTPAAPRAINADLVLGGRTLGSLPPEQQQRPVAQLGDAALLAGAPATPGLLQPGGSLPFTGANGYLGIRSDLGGEAYRATTTADRAAWHSLQDAFDNGAYRALETAGIDPQQLINFRGAYSVDKLLSRAKVSLSDGTTIYDPSKIAQLVKAKDSASKSYMENLPGDVGEQLRDLANAGRYMQPTSSSHTAEMGVAGKVFTGEMLADLAREGPASVAGPAGALYAMPKLINLILQGTRGGIPGVRNIPGAGPTLASLVTGAGAPAVQQFAPQIPAWLAPLLAP